MWVTEIDSYMNNCLFSPIISSRDTVFIVSNTLDSLKKGLTHDIELQRD